MNKVLLFDFDGTIADSFQNLLEIIKSLSSKYDLPKLTGKQINALRSRDAKTIMELLKIPIYKIPLMAHDVRKIQGEHIAKLEAFKDIPKILHKLKDKKFTLSILTSNKEANVKKFLSNNHINIFNNVYGDAGIFQKARAIGKFLKKNHYKKDEVIYIGDEIRDILACRKIGIKIVSVTWGYNSKESLIKNKPDFVANTPKELLKIFGLISS